MKLIAASLAAAIAVACLIIAPAFAQEAASPEITGWSDFFDGWLKVNLGWLGGPLVLQFLMSQARAMFPVLGNLGVFTVIGDMIAGNWGHAKNAR